MDQFWVQINRKLQRQFSLLALKLPSSSLVGSKLIDSIGTPSVAESLVTGPADKPRLSEPTALTTVEVIVLGSWYHFAFFVHYEGFSAARTPAPEIVDCFPVATLDGFSDRFPRDEASHSALDTNDSLLEPFDHGGHRTGDGMAKSIGPALLWIGRDQAERLLGIIGHVGALLNVKLVSGAEHRTETAG